MIGIASLFTALSIFGIGVTIIDFLGMLEHAHDNTDHHGTAHDNTDHHGTGHDNYAHPHAENEHISTETANNESHNESHDHAGNDHNGESKGNLLSSFSTDKQISSITRLIGALRTFVYFSLGAGPTGIVAIITGKSIFSSLLWACFGGLFVFFITSFIRKLVKTESDSSYSPDDFLLEKAEVTIPVLPGSMGTAKVRKYEAEISLYIKAADKTATFPKGSFVRIMDYEDGCYKVEPDT